jgi:hypothetical protein
VSVRILIGDTRRRLRELADVSVHCVVTSPPYFGLRDYGMAGQIGLEATPDAFVAELVSERRARRIARPRQVVMYLARKHTKLSLPRIGRGLGFRDHTTVMHGANKIEGMLAGGHTAIQAWVDAAEVMLAEFHM